MVILDGHNKVARVEVYQLHIKLLNTKKDGSLNITSEIEVEISKTATVQDLKNIHYFIYTFIYPIFIDFLLPLGCAQMELDQAKCRLWNNFTAKSSGWGKEMKDTSKTLEDATIVDGQKV